MAGLDELRTRVEAAEEQFGLIAAESTKYSERLTGLMSKMELAHADQQREIAALNGRLGQFERENGSLKSMLHGLLQAMENGGQGEIGTAVREMESRIGRLVGNPAEDGSGDPEANVSTDLGDDAIHGPEVQGISDTPIHDTAADDDQSAASPDDGIDGIDGVAASDPPGETTVVAMDGADDDTGADAEDPMAADLAGSESGDGGEPEPAAEDEAAPSDEFDAMQAMADAAGVDSSSETAAKQDDLHILNDDGDVQDDDDREVIFENADASVDDPVDRVSTTDSANELLCRVEAAASALLNAGAEDGEADETGELSAEITALLQSAIDGTEPSGDPGDIAADDDDDLMMVDSTPDTAATPPDENEADLTENAA